MTPRQNIILWLVATVAVAALTSWAFSRRLSGTNSGAAASTEAASGLSLHDWMHRHLDISPAQHELLEPMESAYARERLRLRGEIRQLGSELAVAMRDAAPEAAVLGIQTRLNAAQGALQRATLTHFLQMKQHLNPRQARELAIRTHDSLLLQPAD